MCGRTDTVEALIKHGANIHMNTQDEYLHVYEEVRIFVYVYLFSFLISVDDTYHIHVYAMFSFCRMGTLHYILLLNLVKQIQWKH